MSRDLFFNLSRTFEWSLNRSMQVPLVPFPDELRAACFCIHWQFSSSDTDLDPIPTGSRPDFENNTILRSLLPHACIQRDRFVPGPWCNGGPFMESLAFSFCFLFGFLPASAMGIE